MTHKMDEQMTHNDKNKRQERWLVRAWKAQREQAPWVPTDPEVGQLQDQLDETV